MREHDLFNYNIKRKPEAIQPEVLPTKMWQVDCGEHGLLGIYSDYKAMDMIILDHQEQMQCLLQRINIQLVQPKVGE